MTTLRDTAGRFVPARKRLPPATLPPDLPAALSPDLAELVARTAALAEPARGRVVAQWRAAVELAEKRERRPRRVRPTVARYPTWFHVE